MHTRVQVKEEGEDHKQVWEMVHHMPVREMELVDHMPVMEMELVDRIPVPEPKVRHSIHNHHKKVREKLPEAKELPGDVWVPWV